jgi:hypothetical protein
MGVITQGILGPISGKVGPVVGGSWKGIGYLRGYQATVAQPNTASQVAQKTRMAGAVRVAKVLLTQIIKPLNDRFAVRMSGYNMWISRNIEFFSSLGVPTFSSLIMSEGSLTPVDPDSVTLTDGSANVTVDWTDNTGTGTALATDEAYIVILNVDTQGAGFSSGLVARDVETAVIVMSVPNNTGDETYTYMSMRSANGFNVSDSSVLFAVVP